MKFKKEYQERLIEFIRLFDHAIFKENLLDIEIVDRLDGRLNSGSMACFTTIISEGKNEVPYKYQVPNNIKGSKQDDFSDLGILVVAIHEVRHRFQIEKPQCVLKAEFILDRNKTAKSILEELYRVYIPFGKKYYEREVDAWIIHLIAEDFFKKNGRQITNCISGLIKIVKCTPEDYDFLMAYLYAKSRLVE